MNDFRNECCQDDGGSAPVDKRNGGCGVLIGRKLYVWGGQTEDIIDGERESQDLPRDRNYCNSSLPSQQFDVLDIIKHTWTRQETYGTVPVEQGLGSSLIYDSNRDMIYLFGGLKGNQFDSDMYALSLADFCWKILEPKGGIKPAPRYNSEVFLHNDKLYVYGGIAKAVEVKLDPNAKWISAAADSSYGWSDEYLVFDLTTRCWEAPLQEGNERPLPLGGHRIAKYDKHTAVLFGGKGPQDPNRFANGRSNEVWLLNLLTNVWKGPHKPQSPPNDCWPKPTRFFTFTPLLDPNALESNGSVNQKLLLLWGKAINSSQRTAEDCHKGTWIMEIINEEIIWTELVIHEKPRAWHISVAYYPMMSTSYCSINCDVIVFGGNKHVVGDTGPRNAVSDTCIIEFGVRSLQKLCLNTICAAVDDLCGDYWMSLSPKLHKLIEEFFIAKQQTVKVVQAQLKDISM